KRINLQMMYVILSSKGNEEKNAIERQVSPEQKVVIVEDIISTGKSVIEAANKVEEAGGDVIGAVAIFIYELQEGHEAFEKQAYSLNTLTSYPELIEFAVQSEELLPYKETLNDWYKDPVKWSEQAK